jgi:hypothetical protein
MKAARRSYRAFAAFNSRERVMVDKDVVARGEHLVGKSSRWRRREAQGLHLLFAQGFRGVY